MTLKSNQTDLVLHFEQNVEQKFHIVMPYRGYILGQSDQNKTNAVSNLCFGSGVITMRQKPTSEATTEIYFVVETDEQVFKAYFTSNSPTGKATLEIGYPPENGHIVDLTSEVAPDPNPPGEPMFTVQLDDNWVEH